MIQSFLAILFVWCTISLKAQASNDKLIATIAGFHQALVSKNIVAINQQTDKALSYGHSNGWVENKSDLLKNLESGVMQYDSYLVDSLVITSNENLANARFSANVSATLKGQRNNFQLRVLEVWVKKGNRWVLFARQAVRKQI